MISSFIVTPDLFTDPDDESGATMRESGIEDRFKEIIERCDSNFWVTKIDWSDGVIRNLNPETGELRFWGIQECKTSRSRTSIYEQAAQACYYLCDRIIKYPKLKDSAKLLFLSTDKYIRILYLQDLLNTSFWKDLQRAYLLHKENKGSASNFFKGEGKFFIFEHFNDLKRSDIPLDRDIDFKIVIQNIYKNCL